MKQKILFIALALFLVGNVNAQSDTTSQKKEKEKGKFGSFMRKVGEQTTGINMTDEPFIVNPLKSAIEIKFVGAYGDPTTGKVMVVIKAKNKTYESNATFGSGADKSAAFDKKGKTYKAGEWVGKSYDTPKDLWVEVNIENAIREVPNTLDAFELINMYCYLNANNRGLIELRNIPIQWGVMPE